MTIKMSYFGKFYALLVPFPELVQVTGLPRVLSWGVVYLWFLIPKLGDPIPLLTSREFKALHYEPGVHTPCLSQHFKEIEIQNLRELELKNTQATAQPSSPTPYNTFCVVLLVHTLFSHV